eukprot:6337297-Pyramimonas_sp.AAC.1
MALAVMFHELLSSDLPTHSTQPSACKLSAATKHSESTPCSIVNGWGAYALEKDCAPSIRFSKSRRGPSSAPREGSCCQSKYRPQGSHCKTDWRMLEWSSVGRDHIETRSPVSSASQAD